MSKASTAAGICYETHPHGSPNLTITRVLFSFDGTECINVLTMTNDVIKGAIECIDTIF